MQQQIQRARRKFHFPNTYKWKASSVLYIELKQFHHSETTSTTPVKLLSSTRISANISYNLHELAGLVIKILYLKGILGIVWLS